MMDITNNSNHQESYTHQICFNYHQMDKFMICDSLIPHSKKPKGYYTMAIT